MFVSSWTISVQPINTAYTIRYLALCLQPPVKKIHIRSLSMLRSGQNDTHDK